MRPTGRASVSSPRLQAHLQRPGSLRRPTSRADRPEAVQRSFRARRAIAILQRLHRCWIDARKGDLAGLLVEEVVGRVRHKRLITDVC